jgi:hypothetical protein
MAVLTTAEKAEISRDVCTKIAVNYDKTQAFAAIQAIEDYIETTARPGLSAAINAATTPLTLTAGQKKALVAYYFRSKFTREGV